MIHKWLPLLTSYVSNVWETSSIFFFLDVARRCTVHLYQIPFVNEPKAVSALFSGIRKRYYVPLHAGPECQFNECQEDEVDVASSKHPQGHEDDEQRSECAVDDEQKRWVKRGTRFQNTSEERTGFCSVRHSGAVRKASASTHCHPPPDRPGLAHGDIQ